MKALRNSPDWDVVGVVEPDPELRSKAEQETNYEGLKWMSAEELLNVPGLEAVAVETKVNQLLDAAEMCIAAGKHIHLDKPPGSNFQRFRQLWSEADPRHFRDRRPTAPPNPSMAGWDAHMER